MIKCTCMELPCICEEMAIRAQLADMKNCLKRWVALARDGRHYTVMLEMEEVLKASGANETI